MIDTKDVRDATGEYLLIADQSPFQCEATRALVREWGLFGEIEVAHSLSRILQYVRERPGGIVLLVDRIGTNNPQDIVEQIQAIGNNCRIVVLMPAMEAPAQLESLLARQPSGMITRADSPHVIYRCLHSVCLGASYRSEIVISELRRDARESENADDEDGLTDRQREVLCLLAEGFSVKEIAAMMHLSAKSVDSHKYRIMKKLKLNDRVRLARYAIREGLIEA